MLIAFIGMDPVTATPRYTFGILFLIDGISFPVAMIGLFAVSEMMKLHLRGRLDRQPQGGHQRELGVATASGTR